MDGLGVRARREVVAGVKAVFGAAGFQLSRVPGPDSVFATMAERRPKFMHDDRVDLVFDVGANSGQFGADLRENGYRGRIVSFEPLAAPFAALQQRIRGDGLWSARQLALGARDGESTINVSSNTWSSSLLPVEPRHVTAAPDSSYVGTQQVAIARLDSIAPDILGAARAVYLKVDVQGYEGEALEGAQETLERVVLVELELSLCELYAGQAPYHELMRGMDSLGFEPVALDNEFVEPGTGRVLQINALFERRAIS